MTPQQFTAKWRNVALAERSAYQQHFLDPCEMLGQPKPASADPQGAWYTFERGVRKTDGGDGWADVWMRDHFGWEYKGKHKDLKAAYGQLLLYRESLENPPVLVVCDLDRFEIQTLTERVRAEADLCCYWFEKACAQIKTGHCQRAGLLATQGIRGGANRRTLARLKDSGGIFFAESDREWILDGANVHVSMVGFDDGTEKELILDGRPTSGRRFTSLGLLRQDDYEDNLIANRQARKEKTSQSTGRPPSQWQPLPSGLLGPVHPTPMRIVKDPRGEVDHQR